MRHDLVKFDFRRAHSTLAGQRENGSVFLKAKNNGFQAGFFFHARVKCYLFNR